MDKVTVGSPRSNFQRLRHPTYPLAKAQGVRQRRALGRGKKRCGYSMSESFCPGEIAGVEGKRIKIPLAVV